jgi:hypothetical protein
MIEQHSNPCIINKVRSLNPQAIVLKTTIKKYGNVVPLLKWFKNEFMRRTPKEPVCENCIYNSRTVGRSNRPNNNSSRAFTSKQQQQQHQRRKSRRSN